MRINKFYSIPKEMKLYFFCLEIGDKSLVLNVTTDWVTEFCNQGFVVTVVCTHKVGEFNANTSNVIVTDGGTITRQLLAVLRIFRVTIQIIRNRKNAVVFYHMHHKALALQGFILKLFGIHQTLWYSHAKAGEFLKIANHFADSIFTTSDVAYPLNHKKIFVMGQAVSARRFVRPIHPFNSKSRLLLDIVSVGRISRAKHLEKLIQSVNSKNKHLIKRICFIGPNFDEVYKEELKDKAQEIGINVEWRPASPYEEMPTVLQEFVFYFTGTEKAIDKSAAEAALGGLIVLTDNLNLLSKVGLDLFYQQEFGHVPHISDQFSILSQLENDALYKLRLSVQKKAISNFSIERVVEKYTLMLRE